MDDQITPPLRRKLAAAVGVNEQYLYQCLTGRRDMNPAEARRIEDETGGVLRRQMLCQKSWRSIWPELATPDTTAEPNHAPAPDGKALGAMAA